MDTDEKQEEQSAEDTEDKQEEKEEKGKSYEDLQNENARMAKALQERNKEQEKQRKRLEKLEEEERKRKEEELSELEKANKRAEEAEQAAQMAEGKAREKLIKAAFMAEAGKIGALHPEDAYRLADTSDVEVQDDDSVTGVAEAVKALVDAGRMPLVAGKAAPNLNGNAGGQERREKETELTQEQAEAARKLGVSKEAYAAQLAAKG